jgi:cytochrome b
MSDVVEVKQARRVAVWDPVVRYGHWLLVVACVAAHGPSGEPGACHDRWQDTGRWLRDCDAGP